MSASSTVKPHIHRTGRARRRAPLSASSRDVQSAAWSRKVRPLAPAFLRFDHAGPPTGSPTRRPNQRMRFENRRRHPAPGRPPRARSSRPPKTGPQLVHARPAPPHARSARRLRRRRERHGARPRDARRVRPARPGPGPGRPVAPAPRQVLRALLRRALGDLRRALRGHRVPERLPRRRRAPSSPSTTAPSPSTTSSPRRATPWNACSPRASPTPAPRPPASSCSRPASSCAACRSPRPRTRSRPDARLRRRRARARRAALLRRRVLDARGRPPHGRARDRRTRRPSRPALPRARARRDPRPKRRPGRVPPHAGRRTPRRARAPRLRRLGAWPAPARARRGCRRARRRATDPRRRARPVPRRRAGRSAARRAHVPRDGRRRRPRGGARLRALPGARHPAARPIAGLEPAPVGPAARAARGHRGSARSQPDRLEGQPRTRALPRVRGRARRGPPCPLGLPAAVCATRAGGAPSSPASTCAPPTSAATA